MDGNLQTSSLKKSRFSRVPRILWGLWIGATVSILLCAAFGGLAWSLNNRSPSVSLVWVMNSEQAAYRGAFVGAVVGWSTFSWREVARAGFISVIALGLYTAYDLLSYILPGSFFDFAFVLHLISYTGLTCSIVYASLARFYRPKASLPEVQPEAVSAAIESI